jgi:RND family efflux transporter MFP subunit
VSKNNLGAAEANLNRITELQGYLKVRAPFAGVITLRNVDAGTLVTEGATLLFRVAQTDRLRTYINVPQSDASSVHVGQVAKLSIPDLSRTFPGTVTRTSNSLDPSSRTLLTEVQVANGDGSLIPGMYPSSTSLFLAKIPHFSFPARRSSCAPTDLK